MPLLVHVLDKPSVMYQNGFDEPPNVLTMRVEVNSDKNQLVQYDPDKGEFRISLILPSSRLDFYPLPEGSAVCFADGRAVTVLPDAEQQKCVTNPIMAVEQDKERKWQGNLIASDTAKQFFMQATKDYYTACYNEGQSMRDTNTNALAVLRDVQEKVKLKDCSKSR